MTAVSQDLCDAWEVSDDHWQRSPWPLLASQLPEISIPLVAARSISGHFQTNSESVRNQFISTPINVNDPINLNHSRINFNHFHFPKLLPIRFQNRFHQFKFAPPPARTRIIFCYHPKSILDRSQINVKSLRCQPFCLDALAISGLCPQGSLAFATSDSVSEDFMPLHRGPGLLLAERAVTSGSRYRHPVRLAGFACLTSFARCDLAWSNLFGVVDSFSVFDTAEHHRLFVYDTHQRSGRFFCACGF